MIPVLFGVALLAVAARLGWQAEVKHLQRQLGATIADGIAATVQMAQAGAAHDAQGMAIAAAHMQAARDHEAQIRARLAHLGAPV